MTDVKSKKLSMKSEIRKKNDRIEFQREARCPADGDGGGGGSGRWPIREDERIEGKRVVPPMLSIPHQLVGAPLGYSVKLECYTEAHPTSLNYWTREDKHMIHDSNKYKVVSTPEVPSYKTHMTLEIFDIQMEDYGAYKCVAKNPRGNTDGVIRLYSKCRFVYSRLNHPQRAFAKLMTDRRGWFVSVYSKLKAGGREQLPC
uniref:Ig-like domain-containing protein n=1 Tax=Vespula pensylvanica TaxID=30213 RepID=A0A834NH23_VESPE|nr:hypothetical protein H0235_013889 [Vespula pensylvanica]